MKKVLVAILLAPALLSAQSRAKNVVLFLADAGGIPTITAASLHATGVSRGLFIQKMPNIALSDTSTASQIVTDSAAGMTAIVTGYKTHNGVISQSADTVRGKTDGAPLKTILEYAEEHGLSTGLVTNDSLTGATPSALYAHANERAQSALIFQQAFAPRFGDGVDVMIGPGRAAITKSLAAAGTDLDTIATRTKRPIHAALSDVPADARRAIVMLDSSAFDLEEAVLAAQRILSRNKKGYFLMVEGDTHTDNVRVGLDRMVALDKTVARMASVVGRDTLLVFTADHSFDIALRGGLLGKPLLDGLEAEQAKAAEEKRRNIRIPAVRMDNGHAGEPVMIAAMGPGADRVRGYMLNTDIFKVMMQAFGWKADDAVPQTAQR
ncbi:Alkaline phosphatase 4 precursor [Luteitalea pratensis]|uniref:Alkaline phosphatase 4 n=1 Tax=Luteitalea pratensis TaxID=1855912 RepID=A0A143PHT3_LUTPR|nr:alkaline phosphatase [Luteitalea pratensis]AMY08095.1 Alkaline phosphatase 4 precursor [Luteitalea pratensis]